MRLADVPQACACRASARLTCEAVAGTVPDLPSEALPSLTDLYIGNSSLEGSLPYIGPRSAPSTDSTLGIYLTSLGVTGYALPRYG